jgi:hypothetical protein
LASGDLITSSTLPGYGQLQTGDLPHVFQNFTVAKATCDCDFTNPRQPIYVVKTDAQGLNVVDPVTGQPVWIQQSATITADQVPQMTLLTQPTFQMRWLAATGTQITEDAYAASLAEGTPVYRAAFVGCTYHCG